MTYEDLRKRIRGALRTDARKARRLASVYARRAAADGDPLRGAEARLLRAEVDFAQGRLRAALQGCRAARSAFASRRASRQVLATDVSAVQICALLGLHEEVRRRSRSLRRTRLGPLEAAYVESAIASAFEGLGDDRAAEESWRRALAALRGRRRPPQVGVQRATARQNLAVRLARRGAVSAALRELDRALAFFDDNGLHATAEEVRYNRGWARGLAGDLARAVEDLRAAREAFVRRGNRRWAALARLDEAELLLRLGDARRAGRAARAAAAGFRRCDLPLEVARAQLVAARAELAAGRR
ncbi:MAG: hypothetical protein ACE5JG_03070, partial [Planctomycetota bacterium]